MQILNCNVTPFFQANMTTYILRGEFAIVNDKNTKNMPNCQINLYFCYKSHRKSENFVKNNKVAIFLEIV